jgi:DNA-3-methyladenine glycosylase I
LSTHVQAWPVAGLRHGHKGQSPGTVAGRRPVSALPTDALPRCSWCGTDPLYVAYHDTEWGVAERDPRALFELLCLEGQQAGLSWITVLRKREHYRSVFSGFDAATIAAFDDARLESILTDPGIIRNRLKVFGIRRNARALLRLEQEIGAFADFLWSFAPSDPAANRPTRLADIATTTPASDAMSRALRKRDFTFVGSTICHAFMQASGMVDDHVGSCFRATARVPVTPASR